MGHKIQYFWATGDLPAAGRWHGYYYIDSGGNSVLVKIKVVPRAGDQTSSPVLKMIWEYTG